MGMKQILVMMVAVVLVGCGEKDYDYPNTGVVNPNKPTPERDPVPLVNEKLIADPYVEKAVRKSLKKLTGELTKTDLVKVTILNMDNTQITDEGLKELAKLQQLEELYMYRTQITDAGLKEIAKLQKLESLSVIGTKVTEAGVAELKKALPNCLISGGL